MNNAIDRRNRSAVVSEAIAHADACLNNVALPTYSELERERDELIALLHEARKLGLTFDIGNAYISRAYIDKQNELNKRIAEATGQ